MTARTIFTPFLFVALTACGAGTAAPAPPVAPPASEVRSAAAPDPKEQALDQVTAIHGAPGPWAVAGYRMGEYALGKLGLSRGSFDLEITHHTPRAVKYSCIADGAAASTGASLGKLNLVLVDADEQHVETTYRRKSTGQSITLRPAAGFGARFDDVPHGQARRLGKEVLDLPAAAVFEEVPAR